VQDTPLKPNSGRRPDFFIIGAQKCGTTWLHKNLRRNPEIFMPEDKDPEIYLNSSSDREKFYERMSAAGDDQLCGDANAAYFWTPDLFGKHPFYNADIAESVIKYFGANIKLLILLREPIQRSISAYLHHIGMRSLDANVNLLDAPEKLGIITQSCYGNNLHHWRQVFANENILVLPAPEKNNHHRILSQAEQFLGVAESKQRNEIIARHVFTGLQRFQDADGVWVNITHPVFKQQKWQTGVAMREIDNIPHALLIKAVTIQHLIDLLAADTDVLQQQLIHAWQHPEFRQWLTWR